MAGKGKNSNAYNHILKCIGLFGSVQGLITLGTLFRSVIVANLLGTAGVGINDAFNKTLNLVKSSTDLGIGFSAVKKISEYYSLDKTDEMLGSIRMVRSWAFVTALFGMVLCLVLAPLFSLWTFDGDSTYTLSFLLLSPVVGCSAIMGAEIAILKATRKLKKVALSQLLAVVLSIVISIPIFWKFSLMGIVPSLVLVSAATLLVTAVCSFKEFPYKLAVFSKQTYSVGYDMIKLGVFYTIAAFFGSGSFAVITNWLVKEGAEIAGLYSVAYLFVTYLGMFVFSAAESDYFPRLSTSFRSRMQINALANRQSEVSLLLISPMILIFIYAIPLFVSLFFKEQFMDAVPIAQIASISLLFKAVTMPVAYISLAKGDSKIYLLQEFLYDAILVAVIILGYRFFSLDGIGLAITVAAVFDWIIVSVIAHFCYGFVPGKKEMRIFVVQGFVVIGGYLLSRSIDGWQGLCAGAAVCAVSCVISYRILKKNIKFRQILISKL